MEDLLLTRRVCESDELMGRAAAEDAGALLREVTAARCLPVLACFAAAPSQDTFLAALVREPGVDWSKVLAVHLDEYFDLPRNHPNTFEVYLREHLFSRVPIPEANVHYIKAGRAATCDALARAYERRLRELLGRVRAAGGVYVACIGIGVNGHIAFNEPHVDKRTGRMVIPVEIDEVSARQQFDDYRNHPNPQARYATPADVPRRAVTLSCAGILAADRIFCMVPGAHKAAAVKAMWDGPVTDDVPASLLRLHPQMTLYLDRAAAALLDRRPNVDQG